MNLERERKNVERERGNGRENGEGRIEDITNGEGGGVWEEKTDTYSSAVSMLH